MKTKLREIERDLEIAKMNYEFVEAINDKLWEIIEDKDMKIAELENENAELQHRIAELECVLEGMRKMNCHRVKVKKVKGKRCLKIIVRGDDDDR